MTTKGTVLYFPHGGGPLPLLGDPGHRVMNEFLTAFPRTRPRPDAVVVISAHWEMDIPVVTAHPNPELIYDYYGFPQETYEIQYPTPGHPTLARKAVDLFTAAGIKSRTDDRRGFDHGLFIPLTLMFPDADIPCIQISLCADLDPTTHTKMGEALKSLTHENILVLGSGFSFHNMRGFGRDGNPDPGEDKDEENQAFQDWLLATCTGEDAFPEVQKEALVRWEQAPGARHCHPREEHLLPLMVCAGAAGYRRARAVFDATIMDRRALALIWEGTP